jgi:hypothetical protein
MKNKNELEELLELLNSQDDGSVVSLNDDGTFHVEKS